MTRHVLSKVLELRPEEPQSYRDLAEVLIITQELGDAVRLLYDVVEKQWDSRFTQFEVVALMHVLHYCYIFVTRSRDLNALLHRVSEVNLLAPPHLRVNCEYVDKRLVQNLPVDIRIVLQWARFFCSGNYIYANTSQHTDKTDVELHVTEPSGEKCYSFNNKTRAGGLLSKDYAAGYEHHTKTLLFVDKRRYGPEEYLIRSAMPGAYKIDAKMFHAHRETSLGTVRHIRALFS